MAILLFMLGTILPKRSASNRKIRAHLVVRKREYKKGPRQGKLEAHRAAVSFNIYWLIVPNPPENVKSAGDGIRRPPLGRAGQACPGEVYP